MSMLIGELHSELSPLTISIKLNEEAGAPPKVIILPNRHDNTSSPVSKFINDVDTAINKEILRKFLRPGDRIWLEYPTDQYINVQKCPELAGLTLPEGVSVRGWDDPATVRELQRLTNIQLALQEILPVKVCIGKETKYQIINTIKYRAAMLLLRTSCANGLTPDMLPLPGMMMSDYHFNHSRCNSFISQRLGEAINNTYVARIDHFNDFREDVQGVHWVLGGKKHFVLYPKSHGQKTDHAEAIENLYANLARQSLFTIICEPVSLLKICNFALNPAGKLKLSKEVVEIVSLFSKSLMHPEKSNS